MTQLPPIHTQPNDTYVKQNDSVTAALILSILAHVLTIAFVIYTFHIKPLPQQEGVEAVVVTPEQLAELQTQIKQNQAAAAVSSNNSNPTLPTETVVVTKNSADVSQRIDDFSNSAAKQVQSVFKKFNRPAYSDAARTVDSPMKNEFNSAESSQDGLLMSAEQRRALREKKEAYQKYLDEQAQKIDEEMQEEIKRREEYEKQIEEEMRNTLNEYKAAEKKGPVIKKPKRVTDSFKVNDSDNPVSVSLSEGQAKTSTGAKTSFGTASNNRPANGAYKNAIVEKIKSHFVAPMGSENDYAMLTLKLDNTGRVLSAVASGSNPAVNEAAQKAAYAASPLPIDVDNPQAFANIRVKIKGS